MDRKESSNRSYRCYFADCVKTFSKPSRLTQHIRTHTGERPYICTYPGCDKQYTRAAHLSRHEDTAHTDIQTSTKKIVCTHPGCSQIYASQYALHKHVTTAHKVTDLYRCPEEGCDKTFRKRQHLRAHKYEHMGVLAFQCDVPECLKKFSQKSHLERHKKRHEGYSCPHPGCTVKFSKWSLIRKHMAVTHRDSHVCGACGKSFPQKSWLKWHSKTHESTREMFKCPYSDCPRAYYESRNLQAHVRSYHEGKKFLCDVTDCNRTFATKQKLLQHVKLHDPLRPMPKKRPKKCPQKGEEARRVVSKLTGVKKGVLSRGPSPSRDPNETLGQNLPAASTTEATAGPMDLTLTPPGDLVSLESGEDHVADVISKELGDKEGSSLGNLKDVDSKAEAGTTAIKDVTCGAETTNSPKSPVDSGPKNSPATYAAPTKTQTRPCTADVFNEQLVACDVSNYEGEARLQYRLQ